MSMWDDALLIGDRALQSVYGEPAVYHTEAGADVALEQAVFSDAYRAVPGNEADIPSSEPMLWVRAEDIPVDLTADMGSVTVAGALYRITNAEPDGEGGVMLTLHKVEDV